MQTKQHTAMFRFTPVSAKVREIFGLSRDAEVSLKGIPSGFHYLDRLTGGFRPSAITTIAARQGMGKTAMLLSLMGNMALRDKHSLAVFSLERPAEKLVKRLVECETGTSVDKIIRQVFKDREKERIYQLLQDLAAASIMIDDTQHTGIESIVHHIELLVETHDPDLIFIDYLDLIRKPIDGTAITEEQYESILRILSQTAIDHELPIVLFHQVVQPWTPSNQGYRLSAGDLPAAVLKYSDAVMLLQRADYKGSARSFAEISLVKHPEAEGEKTIALRFIESIDRFVDFE